MTGLYKYYFAVDQIYSFVVIVNSKFITNKYKILF